MMLHKNLKNFQNYIYAIGHCNLKLLIMKQIYDPGCGHCQNLEPIYNKLGKHLRGINSLVIAKMDGTSNEHPRAKVFTLRKPVCLVAI